MHTGSTCGCGSFLSQPLPRASLSQMSGYKGRCLNCQHIYLKPHLEIHSIQRKDSTRRGCESTVTSHCMVAWP
jgi:hypothetical protein